MQKQDDILMDRKTAAKYIGFQPSSLAVWACTKKYDLKPIKIGKRAVRYRKSVLDLFLQGQLTD